MKNLSAQNFLELYQPVFWPINEFEKCWKKPLLFVLVGYFCTYYLCCKKTKRRKNSQKTRESKEVVQRDVTRKKTAASSQRKRVLISQKIITNRAFLHFAPLEVKKIKKMQGMHSNNFFSMAFWKQNCLLRLWRKNLTGFFSSEKRFWWKMWENFTNWIFLKFNLLKIAMDESKLVIFYEVLL